jgi:CDGSH-type Zn-finger protein
MQVVNHIVKESLPNYLANLPIPDTILGWFKLSVSEWARLVPFGLAVSGLSYLSLQGLANSPVIGPMIKDKLAVIIGKQKGRVNEMVKMECPKVVDTVDIEDITEKAVYCRCWKSKKFPFCDGSHAKHNKETGDNVGPLIVKKSA